MKKQAQNGSVLVVVIIILVIAILSTLGFLLWRNLNLANDTSPQTNSENQSEQSVKLKTAKIDDSFPAKLSWNYPETWTIKSEGSGPAQLSDTTTQKFTLTPPSSRYEVIYYVGWNGGLGGSCQPGVDTLQFVQRTAVSGFDRSLLVEVIHGSTTEGFTYISGLFQNNADVQRAKKGDSFCNVYLRNVIPLTEDGKMVILAAEINITEFDSSDQYGSTETYPKDVEAIKQAFEDPEYKEAIKILLSTISE